jgi:hypothetical protein
MTPLSRIQLADMSLFDPPFAMFVGIAAAKFTANVRLLDSNIPTIAKIIAFFLFILGHFFRKAMI